VGVRVVAERDLQRDLRAVDRPVARGRAARGAEPDARPGGAARPLASAVSPAPAKTATPRGSPWNLLAQALTGAGSERAGVETEGDGRCLEFVEKEQSRNAVIGGPQRRKESDACPDEFAASAKPLPELSRCVDSASPRFRCRWVTRRLTSPDADFAVLRLVSGTGAGLTRPPCSDRPRATRCGSAGANWRLAGVAREDENTRCVARAARRPAQSLKRV
jgi:hypothetical protein